MNRVKVKLPDHEHIFLQCSFITSVVSVFREPEDVVLDSSADAHSRQDKKLQKVLALAPTGNILGMDVGKAMCDGEVFSCTHAGAATLRVGRNNLLIKAEIVPTTLFFGAVKVPTFIYAHCRVKVYIDDSLYFEHVFM